MPANFSSYSNFNKDANYESVRFGMGAKVLEVELNELQNIQSEARAEIVRDSIHSGFLKLSAIDYVYNSTNPNKIKLSEESVAYVNGYKVVIPAGTVIALDAPSISKSRDDLVFLEVWKEEIDYTKTVDKGGQAGAGGVTNTLRDGRVGVETARRVQLKWRLRSVSDTNFVEFPEGFPSSHTEGYAKRLNYIFAMVQGGNASPITSAASSNQYYFSKAGVDTTRMSSYGYPSDIGLYMAGDGSQACKDYLKTVDGYVYAIPMFKVFRRASAGYEQTGEYDVVAPLGSKKSLPKMYDVNYDVAPDHELAGTVLKNEVKYDPKTWAEWVKTAGVVGDATGLEFTVQLNGFVTAELNVNIKPSIKYGLLYNVASKDVVSGSFFTTSGNLFPSSVISAALGNNKVVVTSAASGNNKIGIGVYGQNTMGTAGQKIKISGVRVFELPAGSQIEKDFDSSVVGATNLTADQLAAKYPWTYGEQVLVGNKIGYAGSNGQIPDIRLFGNSANSIIQNGNFANGTTKWTNQYCSLAASGNVMTATGQGIFSQTAFYQTTSIPYSVGRKIYIQCKLRVTNASCLGINIRTYGSGTMGNIQTVRQASPTNGTWYTLSGVVTLDSIATGMVNVQCMAEYADAATSNGKVMEVQEVMVIDMGTSASDNYLYNLTTADMNQRFPTWLKYGIVSTKPVRVRIVGKNLANNAIDNWEIGSVSTTNGQNTVAANGIRTKQYVRVKSNTAYYKSVGSGYSIYILCYYDINKNFISSGVAGNSTFTTPANCEYVRFVVTRNDSANMSLSEASNVYFQVENGTVQTTYEAYTETVAYVSVDELRRLPNNVFDEYSVTTGEKTQRTLKTTLGDVTWERWSDNDTTNYWCVRNSVLFSGSSLGVSTSTDCWVLDNYNGSKYIVGSEFQPIDALSTLFVSGQRFYIKIPKVDIVGTIDDAKAKAWISSRSVALSYQTMQSVVSKSNVRGRLYFTPGQQTLIAEPVGSQIVNPALSAGKYTITAPTNCKIVGIWHNDSNNMTSRWTIAGNVATISEASYLDGTYEVFYETPSEENVPPDMTVTVGNKTFSITGGIGSINLTAADLPYRRVPDGARLRMNELAYNRDTWAEWANTAGVVGDSTGLEFTADGVNYRITRLPTSIKASTKYGLLYEVVSSSIVNNFVLTGDAFNYQITPKTVGNQKLVVTSNSTIATNKFGFQINVATEPSGNKIKIRGIRVFELPAGSEIAADFNTKTADELAVKYPYISGYPDRVDNLFANIVADRDVLDLRHQVSLTGFNYQSLLEENFDKLLRGELQTKDRKKTQKVYYGLPKTPVDDNTVFYASLDGTNVAEVGGVMSSISSYKPSATGLGLDTNGSRPTTTLNAAFNDQLTMDVVCRFTTKPTVIWGRILGLHTDTDNYIEIQHNSDMDTIFAQLKIGGTAYSCVYSKPVINYSTVHHLRVTVGSGFMSLYVDGVLMKNTAIPTNINLSSLNTSRIRIGESSSGSLINYTILSDVHISNIDRGDTFVTLPKDFIAGKAVVAPAFNPQRKTYSDALTGQYTTGIARAKKVDTTLREIKDSNGKVIAKDTIENGEVKIQTAKYTLQASDIADVIRPADVNIDLARIPKMADSAAYTLNGIMAELQGKTRILQSQRDNISSIGCYYIDSDNRIYYVIAKGDTLVNAKTALTGVSVTYQLAQTKTYRLDQLKASKGLTVSQSVADTWTSGDTIKVKGLAGEIISGVIDSDTALARILSANGTSTVTLDDVSKLVAGDTVSFNGTNPATIASVDTTNKTIITTAGTWDSSLVGGYVYETTVSSSAPVVKFSNSGTMTTVTGTWSGLGTNEATFTLGTTTGLTNQDIQIEYSLNMTAGQGQQEVFGSTLGGEVNCKNLIPGTVAVLDDFVGKIAGSTVECPNVCRVTNSASIQIPSAFINEVSDVSYGSMKTLNGTTYASSTSVSGEMPQVLFSFNLIRMVEDKYGEIPVVDKVQWLKDNIINIYMNWYGYGSCPSGSKANMARWDANANNWHSSIATHTNNSINQLMRNPTVSTGIDTNGFSHFIVYTDASNGTIASTVYTDYVSLSLELKTPAGYDVLVPENNRRDGGKANILLVRKETKETQTFFQSRPEDRVVVFGEYLPYQGALNVNAKILVLSKQLCTTTAGTGAPSTNAAKKVATHLLPKHAAVNDFMFSQSPIVLQADATTPVVNFRKQNKVVAYWTDLNSSVGDTFNSLEAVVAPSLKNPAYHMDIDSGLVSANGELFMRIKTGVSADTSVSTVNNVGISDFKISGRPLVKGV